MYKQCRDMQGNICNTIIRLEDQAFIPFDPMNTDYQEYLRWLADGNYPESADNE